MSNHKDTLKNTLRTEARRHRSRVDMSSEDPELAVDYFFNAIKPKPEMIVSAYWPKNREFDPRPIMERLLADNFICALPVVKKDSLELGFARWDESIKLKEGAFKIMEPSIQNWVEPDIVIVPLLAFDRKGFRLGQGGGYYDVTLKNLRNKKDILAVGTAYAKDAVLFNLPVEEHDQRLDWVITPQGSHYFK